VRGQPHSAITEEKEARDSLNKKTLVVPHSGFDFLLEYKPLFRTVVGLRKDGFCIYDLKTSV
jgi:hypothetical protein